jgi:carboxyl-terminal processing protease
VVDDAVLAEFREFLKSKNIDVTDANINANLDWVKESIKSDLFTSQFGQIEGQKVRAEWDPQIIKAIGYLPQAQSLEENIGKPKATTTASR